MSFTGPGCKACDFKGWVRWPGGGMLEHKPCDACGGLSQFTGDEQPTVAALTARVRELEARLADAEARFSRCGGCLDVIDAENPAKDCCGMCPRCCSAVKAAGSAHVLPQRAAGIKEERERCHQIASHVANAWATRARTAPTPLFAGMGAAEEIDAKITKGFDPNTWLETERAAGRL